MKLVNAVYGDSLANVGWHDCDLCSRSLVTDESLGDELWYDDGEGLYVCKDCAQSYLAGESSHATGTSSE